MASNRLEQSHLKKVGLLFAVMVPLLALSVYQLYSAHKVSARELVSMTTFFGGVLSLSGLRILARYFGGVLPMHDIQVANRPTQMIASIASRARPSSL